MLADDAALLAAFSHSLPPLFLCRLLLPPGELQYQGRHVQGLLARNSALQGEAAELRVSLSISRRVEEELAGKALACEKLIDSLVSHPSMWRERKAAGQLCRQRWGSAWVLLAARGARGGVSASTSRHCPSAERSSCPAAAACPCLCSWPG